MRKNPLIQALLISVLYFTAVSVLYMTGVMHAAAYTACLISGLLSLGNTFVFLWASEKGKNRKNSEFLLYILGSMTARILLLLIIIFILFWMFNIDKFAFVFSFFFSYIIFLIFEVTCLARKAKDRRTVLTENK